MVGEGALILPGSLSSASQMPSVWAGCSGLVELVPFSEPVHSPPVGSFAVGMDVAAPWSVLVFVQEAAAMSGFTVALSSSPHFSPSLVT